MTYSIDVESFSEIFYLPFYKSVLNPLPVFGNPEWRLSDNSCTRISHRRVSTHRLSTQRRHQNRAIAQQAEAGNGLKVITEELVL
jgi:hypothetical protein